MLEETINNDWELCFIALTESATGEKSVSSWNGDIYCRRGGQEHPCWWNISKCADRAEKMPPSFRINNLNNRLHHNWSVCVYVKNRVYVKKEACTPENIRQQLMKSCGGQCKKCIVQRIKSLLFQYQRETIASDPALQSHHQLWNQLRHLLQT